LKTEKDKSYGIWVDKYPDEDDPDFPKRKLDIDNDEIFKQPPHGIINDMGSDGEKMMETPEEEKEEKRK
jgi:hypothetical protein